MFQGLSLQTKVVKKGLFATTKQSFSMKNLVSTGKTLVFNEVSSRANASWQQTLVSTAETTFSRAAERLFPTMKQRFCNGKRLFLLENKLLGATLLLQIYVSTYIHIYLYTYIHIYIYTYIHICIFTIIHLYIYTFIHLYIYTFTQK